ncbi:MAG: hypothetical protein MR905_09165 [Prevotella sp.]|nr:hypothetical protein [Prevotella sp.]
MRNNLRKNYSVVFDWVLLFYAHEMVWNEEKTPVAVFLAVVCVAFALVDFVGRLRRCIQEEARTLPFSLLLLTLMPVAALSAYSFYWGIVGSSPLLYTIFHVLTLVAVLLLVVNRRLSCILVDSGRQWGLNIIISIFLLYDIFFKTDGMHETVIYSLTILILWTDAWVRWKQ